MILQVYNFSEKVDNDDRWNTHHTQIYLTGYFEGRGRQKIQDFMNITLT